MANAVKLRALETKIVEIDRLQNNDPEYKGPGWDQGEWRSPASDPYCRTTLCAAGHVSEDYAREHGIPEDEIWITNSQLLATQEEIDAGLAANEWSLGDKRPDDPRKVVHPQDRAARILGLTVAESTTLFLNTSTDIEEFRSTIDKIVSGGITDYD